MNSTTEKWVVESWDGSKWYVENEFDNQEDCAAYYVGVKHDYPNVTFRARRIQDDMEY